MKYCSLLGLLVVLFWYCKPARAPQAYSLPGDTSLSVAKIEASNMPNEPQKSKPITITLLAESALYDLVFAYYEDQFQDHHNIFFRRDSSSQQYRPVTLKSRYPLWLRFAGKGGGQYPVYLEPGDKLRIQSFTTGSTNYVFTGKYPQEHNFYNQMHQQGAGSLGFPDIMGLEIDSFRLHRRTKMYHYLLRERLNFVAQQKDFLNIRPAFYRFLQTEINTEAISGLLAPYYADHFKHAQLPERYLDTLASFGQVGWLRQDSLVNISPAYRRTIWHYNRFLSRRALRTPQELETLYADARAYYTGQVRDFALFYLVRNSLREQLPTAQEYLARFRKDCTYPPYVHYLDSITSRPAQLVQQETLLNTLLETEQGETTTWQQILDNNKGKVLYVDLWATWCSPCLVEMPFAQKHQTVLRGKDLVFINLSIDKPQDRAKWKKLIVQKGLNQGGQQHYLLAEDSPLARFIHGRVEGVEIPQYVLINQKGEVVTLQAKRPSDPELRPELLRLLSQKN